MADGKPGLTVFLLPGYDFTQGFVESWTETVNGLAHAGIPCGVRWRKGSDIYGVRNGVLEAKDDKAPWPQRKPFGGIDYEQVLWIDSDTVFTTQDVLRILSHPEDVVAGCVPINRVMGNWGWYREEDGKPCLSYVTLGSAEEWKYDPRTTPAGLMEIDFAGLAFMKMRRGVLERIGYPWFVNTIGEYRGMKFTTSEDVGFCYRLKKLGFKIWGDTQVRLAHEKPGRLEWPK